MEFFLLGCYIVLRYVSVFLYYNVVNLNLVLFCRFCAINCFFCRRRLCIGIVLDISFFLLTI